MPIPTEVDDLDKAILSVNKSLIIKQNRISDFTKRIETARQGLYSCEKIHIILYRFLKVTKEAQIINLIEYKKDIVNLENNLDCLQRHKTDISYCISQVNLMKKETQLLYIELEGLIAKRTEWGQVIPFSS